MFNVCMMCNCVCERDRDKITRHCIGDLYVGRWVVFEVGKVIKIPMMC